MNARLDRYLAYKVSVLGIALVLGGAGVWLLNVAHPEALEVAPSIVLHDVPQSTITTAVQAYSPKAKHKLGLPKDIQDNEAKVVLTATDLPKSKHERTISTVLDTTTGEAAQYVETKPLKWLDSTRTGSVGLYYGFKNLEPTSRFVVTQDVFTVKALSFGVHASVDVTQAGRIDTFIGAGARLDW